jgi:hypothetical protein
MEFTSGAEKLAQDWKLKIQDWNLNACLVAGLSLADGVQVSEMHQHGFYDHKTNFGQIMPLRFSVTVPDVSRAHPDANLLAVFPYKNGQEIVWYQFKNFMPATVSD